MNVATLRARLARPTPPLASPAGDQSPAEHPGALARLGRPPSPAAVLMLLAVHADADLRLVLTQRSAALSEHAGQISLPGGRIEATDDSARAAALREAHEEIGAKVEAIELLAELPRYNTATGYEITPIVALTPPQVWRVDESEVVDVFEVPLSHLLDTRRWRRDHLLVNGRERHYWAVPWRERYIWGATAGMLRMLCERLWS
ncbi:MAG: CoA pyrophosphatase [Casimicrobiaceae bacterium]|nr:CoA pyrophosphatase [Casimicrobiaceae bacterium]MCX8098451.1 CoA pyrophosphatase [Casimicrobiaceae bacterium]MDW8311163.1 CoA pyrophosphatase [Burkholderiales bacterium]